MTTLKFTQEKLVGGFQTKRFRQNCVNEESSTERCSYNRRVKQILSPVMPRPESMLITQDQESFLSLVKSSPPDVVSVLQYCLSTDSERLPRFVSYASQLYQKVAMFRAFTVGFKKSFRVAFYFSWFCPVKLTTFCTAASLKVLFINAFDAETKKLDTDIFPQHTIADLNSSITFIVLFSQKKPLR